MLFTIIILILVGVVAYFQYLGGFLSALISVVCTIFAAALALGYHETLVEMLLGGKMADYAHPLILIGLFAAIYLVLRLIFDAFVPGNIQIPYLMDKIGSGVLGLIAGLFTMGVFAVAAQQLPFGPSIAGYSRMALSAEREIGLQVPGASTRGEFRAYDELEKDQIDPDQQKGIPMLPVDDLLVGFVNKQSSGGALAGVRSLTDAHPNYLLELFGQRIGVQVGAKRVAFNTTASEQARLEGVFRLSRPVPQIQGELKAIKDLSLNSPRLTPSDTDPLLVVRVNIDIANAGENGKFRFSLGSVRLKTSNKDGEDRNVWPIATLEEGVAIVSRADDFLIMGNKPMVDLVFRVPGDAIDGDKLAAGSFLEIKRMARLDLSDAQIKGDPPVSAQVGLVWKKPTLDLKAAARSSAGAAGAGSGGGSAAAAGEDAVILVRGEPRASDQLFTPINVATGDREGNNLQFGGGTGSLRDRKFSAFRIDGSLAVARFAAGEYTVQQLAAPAGKTIVQITGDPNRADAWKWGDVAKFELEDSTGAKHKPNGAWAKLVVGTGQHFIGSWDADKPISDVDQIEGRPTEVTLAFALPKGVKLTALRYDGKPVATVSFTVP